MKTNSQKYGKVKRIPAAIINEVDALINEYKIQSLKKSNKNGKFKFKKTGK